jgi:integrase
VPKSATSPTTAFSRRHGPVVEELGYPSRFVRGRIDPAPAVCLVPPRPFGDLGTAGTQRICDLVTTTWQRSETTTARHRKATALVLDYLASFPGQTWQQRLDASPLAVDELATDLPAGWAADATVLKAGLRVLYCLRVLQPSAATFLTHGLTDYAESFRAAQGDERLDTFFQHVNAYTDVTWLHRQEAAVDICRVLTVQGVAFADLTPAALLHYANEVRRLNRRGPRRAHQRTRFPGLTAWNVLHAMGQFPSTTPSTMREALLRGQLSVEELVDRYTISDQAVRQLLIDYLQRRKADCDYATINHLARLLASHFWAGIERINPGQVDLRISPETYQAWRQSITTYTLAGQQKERTNQDDIVIAVRSLYLDLHTWAAAEPERWAIWVAPCPVPPGELRGGAARRRRVGERSADRTRVRQPRQPALVAHVEAGLEHAQAVLEQAGHVPCGDEFTVNGRVYRRVFTASDRRVARHETPPLRAIEKATGALINLVEEEEEAFWTWAAVQTLRHSGVRIEELLELTHLSIRQYQRENGEVIALLVIAPSKTDRERVIPISAELFHVIAQIIRRQTRNDVPIPPIRRFDPHDKLWSIPLPFLFQRVYGTRRAVFTTQTIASMLTRRCQELAQTNPAFLGLKFTPHDFRRIFTTELVNSGLPIHIGAALLGHLDIRTTRGYVAVFDEDVVRHSLEFFARRRALRPPEEYRDPTDTEWAEFEGHFDKRKVELGSCARPYGTPCQHEHACIRCPMLHVNPKMIGRIDELETDLLARRDRAETEKWAGEIDGIDLTLTFLRSKREEAERLTRRPPIDLGFPAPRTPSPKEASS